MKKYLIFLDILGFNELPKELGEKSGFDEDSIRQNYLSDPLMRIIKMVENECNVIKGTDNYIIIAENLQLVSKVIGKVKYSRNSS